MYLLVREDEEDGIPEFVLVQHSVQLLLGLADSLAVVAVDDENQPLRVLTREIPRRGGRRRVGGGAGTNELMQC